MCILCNMGDNYEVGAKFLTDYEASRKAMNAALESMLAVSKIKREYDPIYRQMRRIQKEWNKIEQIREKREN